MGSIRDIQNPWRSKFKTASFRGETFHVEIGAQAGGLRVALHEYAKRNEPYAEDMGRKARRFHVSGYLIGPRYLDAKNRLIIALDKNGPGTLKMPFPIPGGTAGEMSVMCINYSVVETRERGGMCGVEIDFVEAGKSGNQITAASINPAGQVQSQASSVDATVAKPEITLPAPILGVDPTIPLPQWTQMGLIPSGGWDVTLGQAVRGSW